MKGSSTRGACVCGLAALLLAAVVGCSSTQKQPPVNTRTVAPRPDVNPSPATIETAVETAADASAESFVEKPAGLPNERYALLVGVDNYQGDLAPLRFAARDMRAVAWALTTYGGYPKENVRLLVEKDGHGKPNKQDILDGLTEWANDAKLGEDDTVFFAFSGHGFTHGNRAYLMPLDGKTDSPDSTALPIDDVYELLGETGAGQRFIVVDACRNGLTRSALDAGRVSRSQLQAKAGSSICQLFSCDDGQVSTEDETLESMLPGEKGHGIFTHFLVRGLAGDADANQDQVIELSELYQYTHECVGQYVQNRFQRNQKVRQVVDTNRAKLVLAEHHVPLSRELSSLPGLGGGWWFGEAPWLLPHIREQLPNYVDELKSGDVGEREFLHNVNALHVYDRLKAGFAEYEKRQPREMRKALGEIMAADQNASADEIPLADPKEIIELAWKERGAAQHSLAVLHHWRFSQGAASAKDAAMEAYKDALNDYKILFDHRGLYARCLADFGLFYSQSKDYLNAAECFEEARASIPADEAELLHIECLTNEGNTHRKLGNFERAGKCYDGAYALCSKMTETGEAHPLAIHAIKQKGWCFMDEWRVKEARAAFERARDGCREHRTLNPAAESVIERWIVEFHIEHGLAMCERYGGDLPNATVKYEELVEEVEGKYKTWKRDDPHLNDLVDRLANSYERLTDCYLQGRDDDAVSSIRSARDYYKELVGRVELQLKTHCKLAIAQIVTQDDVDEAEKTLQELDDIRRNKIADEVDEAKRTAAQAVFARIAPYEKVARAIVQAGTDDQVDLLRQIVAEPANDAEVRDKLDRDDVDLNLIAARELIRRMPSGDQSLPKVVQQLYDMIPPRHGTNRPESLPYRREYYDVGLIAWLKQADTRKLDVLIDHIVESKTNSRYGLKSRKNILVFYFPKDISEHGYCVLRRHDRTGMVLPLETNWKQLRGEKAAWPEDVLKAVREADGQVEVQWSDLVLEPLGLGNIDDLPYVIPDDLTSKLIIQ